MKSTALAVSSASLVILIFGLAACSAFGSPTSQALPTVILGEANATPNPTGGASRPVDTGGVIASGIVAPAQQADLAFSLGGIVESADLAVGDTVTEGQVLVTLAGSQKLAAAVEAAKLELLAAQQALEALDENLPDAQTEALQAVTTAREEVRDAERRLNSLNTPAEDIDVEAAWANVVLARDKLDKARQDYEPYENKSEQNVTRAALLDKLARAQSTYDDAVRRYNNLRGVTGSDFDRSQAEAELSIAQARLKLAEERYAELQNGPDPSDVALAEARIAAAQAQIAASQSALDDLVLKTPFSGTIGDLNIHPGEWVIPGQPVLTLADLANLRIETTDLSERDIPGIQIGQAANIFIEALQQNIPGRVVAISPLADTLGGDVVYQTILDLDSIPEGLRQGMSVEVQFSTGQ